MVDFPARVLILVLNPVLIVPGMIGAHGRPVMALKGLAVELQAQRSMVVMNVLVQVLKMRHALIVCGARGALGATAMGLLSHPLAHLLLQLVEGLIA